jgi:hypothetical protein
MRTLPAATLLSLAAFALIFAGCSSSSPYIVTTAPIGTPPPHRVAAVKHHVRVVAHPVAAHTVTVAAPTPQPAQHGIGVGANGQPCPAGQAAAQSPTGCWPISVPNTQPTDAGPTAPPAHATCTGAGQSDIDALNAAGVSGLVTVSNDYCTEGVALANEVETGGINISTLVGKPTNSYGMQWQLTDSYGIRWQCFATPIDTATVASVAFAWSCSPLPNPSGARVQFADLIDMPEQ